MPDAWLLIGNCSADVIGGIAVAGACCSKIQKIIPFRENAARATFRDPSNFSGLFTVLVLFSCILPVSFLDF